MIVFFLGRTFVFWSYVVPVWGHTNNLLRFADVVGPKIGQIGQVGLAPPERNSILESMNISIVPYKWLKILKLLIFKLKMWITINKSN